MNINRKSEIKIASGKLTLKWQLKKQMENGIVSKINKRHLEKENGKGQLKRR